MREVRTNRCQRCESVVDKTAAPWLACQTCLLAYHRNCWGEGEVCVDCGGTEFYRGKKLKAPAPPKKAPKEAPPVVSRHSGKGSSPGRSPLIFLLMIPASLLSFGMVPLLYYELILFSSVWGQKLGLTHVYKNNGPVNKALEEHRSACFSRGFTKVQDKVIWRVILTFVFMSFIYWLFNKNGYIHTRHPRIETEPGILLLAVCGILWHVLLRYQSWAILRACLTVRVWFKEASAAAHPNYLGGADRLESLEDDVEREFKAAKLYYEPKADFLTILLPLFHIVWVPFLLWRSLLQIEESLENSD